MEIDIRSISSDCNRSSISRRNILGRQASPRLWLSWMSESNMIKRIRVKRSKPDMTLSFTMAAIRRDSRAGAEADKGA